MELNDKPRIKITTKSLLPFFVAVGHQILIIPFCIKVHNWVAREYFPSLPDEDDGSSVLEVNQPTDIQTVPKQLRPVIWLIKEW